MFAVLMCVAGVVYADDRPSLEDLAEARGKVGHWHSYMLEKEIVVYRAYQQGDADTLYRVSMDLYDLLGDTYGAVAKPYWGDKPFWAGDAAGPYAACQTAMQDLALLASASDHAIRTPNETTHKIMAQELQDFLKSKGRCEPLLAMTPAQAWAKYEAE